MNTLQKTFKYLKEKNDRSDRFDIIPAVQCWSADRRVSQLLKMWLVEKRVVDQWKFEKPKTEYKVTDLWLKTIVGDVKLPKQLPKQKKIQEESIVKSEAKILNDQLDTLYWVQEYIPQVKPTTFIWKIIYMYDVRMSL